MDALLQDLKFALRGMAQRPGFASVLVLTLGLGIGTNAAVFSVANGVLFRPLPYERPEELVLVWNRLPNAGVERQLVSGPDFLDYRTETTLFEGFAGAFALSGTLTGEGQAEQVMVGWSTENFFDVLGVRPAVGRVFEPEDAAPVDPALFLDPDAELPPGALLITYPLWQQRFGADRSVIGRTVEMDGQPSFIIGVLPRDFRIYLPRDAGMPTDIDAWRVVPDNFAENARDAEWLTVVARLGEGVTRARAQQEMDALAARLRELYQFHANSDMRITLNSMHEDVIAHARPVLLALMGAAGFVLLIAAANVANLLLVRAASREGEVAVRAALGGGRVRIVTQMVTESAVIAVAGALVGLLLAWLGIRALVAIGPEGLPRIEGIGIDGRVVAFTAGVTAVAAVAFGSVPALKAWRANLANALRDRGGDSGGRRGQRIRSILIVAEIALSFALLVGAGLMVRSFANLRRAEPGFEAEGVLTLSVPLPLFNYRLPGQRAEFYNQLHERLRNLSGVRAVGGITPLPLSGGDPYSIGPFGTDGATEEEWNANTADYKAIIPGYADVMGLELIQGRTFDAGDNQAEALNVALVDATLAERLWPDGDPLGKRVQFESFDVESLGTVRIGAQVVGVVGNVRSGNLSADGRATLYVPYRMFPWLPVTFTIRSEGDPLELVDAIRAEIGAMDPGVPVADVRLMGEYVRDAMADTRFTLTLLAVFAAMALILAAVGLYGAISYAVRQRTQEIGVRVAFGAEGRDIVLLVLRQGLGLALVGVIVGVAGALLLTRVVASLLVGVTATDPVTFFGISTLLLGIAALASYVPAVRATTIDPVEALRDE